MREQVAASELATEIADIRAVMRSPEGRRTLRRLFVRTNALPIGYPHDLAPPPTPFNTNAMQMANDLGKREAVARLDLLARTYCFEDWQQMLVEQDSNLTAFERAAPPARKRDA